MNHPTVTLPPTGVSNIGQMFSMQSTIMKEYQKIEDFPDWPLSLELRENQKLIRDFKERFVGELGEAFADMIMLQALVSSNQMSAKSFCKQFNGEIGDATAFLLEIMIFAGIGEGEIQQWMEAHVQDNPQFAALIKVENVLASLYAYGFFLNQQEGHIIDDERNLYVVLSMNDILKGDNQEWLGCRRINTEFCNEVSQFLWWITFQLGQAVNQLKLKPHTQAENVGNIMGFKDGLIRTFVMYIQLMQYIEKSEKSLYYSYYLTYVKNMERIKGGY